MECPCGTPLKYVADIAAPGYGQSWTCPKCKKNFRVVGSRIIPEENLCMEDFILTKGDVI